MNGYFHGDFLDDYCYSDYGYIVEQGPSAFFTDTRCSRRHIYYLAMILFL